MQLSFPGTKVLTLELSFPCYLFDDKKQIKRTAKWNIDKL